VAGRIRQSDVEEVKARTNIADIIGEYVSLKNAGVGSVKGLCPFHDERSPSFHVRPQAGFYHCFGCGESGDVYSFLQKMEHLSFTESIEKLAERIRFELHYEDGGGSKTETGSRTRILAANAAASEFFVAQLATPGAAIGRTFLGQRGFDRDAAEQFGIGFAPKGWSGLRDHLKQRGFTDDEMLAAGLLSQGDKGVYDRFRERLVWPIRDVTGQTIGFGARKLTEEDKGPKYLNTPETPVYHKAQVLYGLDLAKRDIGKTRQVVVVEGYTDVMAAHLSGVTTAVATCGTSFGVDHIRLIRRVMGDDSGLGEVVFTFDPDAAGQKAAVRAFAEQQRFQAHTFVAVAPDGLDPCDLRLAKGEAAVRALLEHKIPMFEFVIKQVLSNYSLESVEGRAAALRESAPIVAEIRDPALRPGYARELANMVGVDISEAQAAITRAAKEAKKTASAPTPPVRTSGDEGSNPETGATDSGSAERRVVDLTATPQIRLERDALMALIQHPEAIDAQLAAEAVSAAFAEPSLAVIRDAVGASMTEFGGDTWAERVLEHTPDDLKPIVTQLAVAPIPERDEDSVLIYCSQVVTSLVERELLRLKSDLVSRLQRTGESDPEMSRAISEEIVALEKRRRTLKEGPRP
jgi:DNA primase